MWEVIGPECGIKEEVGRSRPDSGDGNRFGQH